MRVGGGEVHLTRKQALVVGLLMEPPAYEWKPGPKIAREVFGDEWKAGAVRKHINRLRVKFGEAGLGLALETEYSRGYRLVVDDETLAGD